MPKQAISFQHLSKEYKTDFWKKPHQALEDVSFEVQEGRIFGLVGPNGAGKTTAIKILMGLIQPSQGQVTFFERNVTFQTLKQEIGYLPENAYYYEYLRAKEMIDFYARLFGYSRKEREKKTYELLNQVGLQGKEEVRLRNFSKGMLQRIGIAQALVNDPKLVILDEPMSGLDPVGRKEVRDIILKLRNEGKTILFSSHILSDVETLCDSVVILVGGKVKAYGSLSELVNPTIKNAEIIFQGEYQKPFPSFFGPFIQVRQIGKELIVTTEQVGEVFKILEWGHREKLSLISVSSQKETFEDIFMEQMRSES